MIGSHRDASASMKHLLTSDIYSMIVGIAAIFDKC
jgi:hypothetical protein